MTQSLLTRRRLLSGGLVLLAGGCGFHLRGSVSLPFKTLFLNINESSSFGAELRRNVRSASDVTLVDAPEKAEAIFDLLAETREKEILSVNSAGRAREYTLHYRVRYRIHDGHGRDFVPSSEISLKRDVSFNEDALLAKESEENTLYKDMQTDMVQQILRRLSLVKI
jgi:LPS-assembly lipoprotein